MTVVVAECEYFRKLAFFPTDGDDPGRDPSGGRAFWEPPIDSFLNSSRPSRRRRSWFAGVALALVSCGAVAQLAAENVLLPLPSGYRVGYENKTARALIVEMVKAGETVDTWTELLTSQTFYNPAAPSPAVFKAATDRAGAEACPRFESNAVDEGPENGYPATVWIGHCPTNPATSKPEWIFFKAIRGKDALYVVQKAFRFEPTSEQIKEASTYLRRVSACDTRSKEHPCPRVTQPSR